MHANPSHPRRIDGGVCAAATDSVRGYGWRYTGLAVFTLLVAGGAGVCSYVYDPHALHVARWFHMSRGRYSLSSLSVTLSRGTHRRWAHRVDCRPYESLALHTDVGQTDTTCPGVNWKAVSSANARRQRTRLAVCATDLRYGMLGVGAEPRAVFTECDAGGTVRRARSAWGRGGGARAAAAGEWRSTQ